jgi:hypothetical protein
MTTDFERNDPCRAPLFGPLRAPHGALVDRLQGDREDFLALISAECQQHFSSRLTALVP